MAVAAALIANGAALAANTAADFDAPQPTLNLQPPNRLLVGDERAQARTAKEGCARDFVSTQPCPSASVDNGSGVHPDGHVVAGPSAAGAGKMAGALMVLEGAAGLLQGD